MENKQYEDAYMKGYLEGCAEADYEHFRTDDGGRLGYIAFAVVIGSCTLFALAASIVQLFC